MYLSKVWRINKVIREEFQTGKIDGQGTREYMAPEIAGSRKKRYIIIMIRWFNRWY